MHRYWIWPAFAVGVILWTAPALKPQQAEAPKSEEYLLLGNADRGAGEPFVFVNPNAKRHCSCGKSFLT